ncbi:hypothetical protein [Pseudochelatococcus sp. G4_1912]|uniref:hypothetical protein n=1 Tax=Pseudochelatococcus sp. G4_1912 TaxID=3114288 RepID=UPI0039C7449E
MRLKPTLPNRIHAIFTRMAASQLVSLRGRIAVGGSALVLLSAASPFSFAPAPQLDLNRIYRVNTTTGEVGACQYGLKEGTIGVTFCFPAGEGAGAQALGEYGLVSSSHTRESGVFRVNYRTGEISSCYVFNTHVVCTPQLSAAETTTPSSKAAPAQTQITPQTDTNPPATPAQ